MKTPLKKADELFSLKIRSAGVCHRCRSKNNLQCAHIISRSYKQIRHNLKNALCLCQSCHIYFTNRPIEWENYVINTIGKKAYTLLKKRAVDYHKKIDYKNIIKGLGDGG